MSFHFVRQLFVAIRQLLTLSDRDSQSEKVIPFTRSMAEQFDEYMSLSDQGN